MGTSCESEPARKKALFREDDFSDSEEYDSEDQDQRSAPKVCPVGRDKYHRS